MSESASPVARRRRNGKEASCEACRKGKLRCDHQHPICARCQYRGLGSRCYYHPAPLTRSRDIVTSNNGEPVGEISTPQSLPRLVNDILAPPTQEGFYGTTHDDRLNTVKDIIGHLRYFPLIDKVVKEYCSHGQAHLIPGPLILPILASLSSIPSKCALLGDSNRNDAEITTLSTRILSSTSTVVNINSSLSVSDFCSAFTEQNLRLEMIGVIFSIAARACSAGLSRDEDSHQDFIQTMFRASLDCRRITKDISPLNDAMLWLTYETVILSSCVLGHSSEIVWSRLGDLSGDVFAFGIHREAFNTTETPFFLAEIRRKTFWKAHQLDFYDRPPRITSRYSDCRLPLDLTDHELCGEPTELILARQRLTPDGWNPEGMYTSTAWTRVRSALNVIREDILEYNFKPTSAESQMRLEDLARRSHDSWESLPARFRHTHECWKSGLQPSVVVSLTDIRLKVLYNDFNIQKLIGRYDRTDAARTALLNIAGETVDIILQLGNARHRAVFVNHEFRYVLLVYGLPSIAVLITALRDISRGSNVLQGYSSRTTLIKNLSVCISHLESFSEAPDENNALCTKASEHISRALEEVLEPFNAAATNTEERPTLFSLNDNSEDATIQPWVAELDLLNSEVFDNFDISTWTNDLEYTGGISGWSSI